jgi:peptide/nickel transport system substrate-binding protein/oligopeptide transport system substrate-binding protein
VAEFETGSLDVLKIPSAELKRFLSDKRYKDHIQDLAEHRVLYIGLNNGREPLSDVRVRRAINLAVDVDQIIGVLAAGQGIPAGGSIPPGLGGYVDREPYGHDPERARELLREAGYGDGFTMEIWQRDSPEGNRILEAVQGYLLQVGITVKLVKREWSAFKEAVSQGRVDAFFLDWYADYPDAENFLYPLFHSDNKGGGGNRVFYDNADVDSLIELAGRTIDDDECERLYARVDSLIHDEAPWLYLYFPKVFHAVSPDVTGYRLPSLYLGADFSSVVKHAD